MKIFKLSTLAPLGIAIALAQPVFGSVIHQLVITENSSSNLTVTLDGQPPVSVGGGNGNDLWVVTFSHTISVPVTVWREAGGTLWNTLTFDATGTVMTITSDVKPGSPAPPTVKNGTTVHGGFIFDGGAFAALDTTFTDKAAASEHESLPDTGSTLGLLSLSLIALLGATHFRAIRLA